MKYLCQVWLDERVMQALSEAEKRDLDRQSSPMTASLPSGATCCWHHRSLLRRRR